MRYLVWRFGWQRASPIVVRLREGPWIKVRPAPSTDLITAFEIFVSQLYEPPSPLPDVSCICDLGANVGYSVVSFCHRFPNARVFAFEPHPVHAQLVRDHLALNHLTARVELLPVAAGTAASTAWLTDNESSSEVREQSTTGAHQIAVMDWLAWAGTRVIDLLKIDIEGSEKPLLADPRFRQLQVRLLVLEWHFDATGGSLHEAQLALAAAGYEMIHSVQDTPHCLLVWARRKAAS